MRATFKVTDKRNTSLRSTEKTLAVLFGQFVMTSILNKKNVSRKLQFINYTSIFNGINYKGSILKLQKSNP